MIKIVGVFLVSALFFSAAMLIHYAPDAAAKKLSTELFLKHLDKRVDTLMNRYNIPGAAIAVVKDGEIVSSKAYGYADVAQRRKLDVDMPMRVQSISKSLTAWAILNLAEEGKINLDMPFETYSGDWKLPQTEFSSNEVTIKRLLSHTAGMPLGDVFTLYSPDEQKPTLKESLTRTAILFQPPGSGFYYSNVGYNLLELLIEEVTQQPFAEYMKNEILLPLGMQNSAFDYSDITNPPKGYSLKGKEVLAYEYPEKASGGLISTVEDIAKFCIAGAKGGQALLSSQSIDSLYQARAEKIGVYGLAFDAYGYGFYTEDLSGKTAVSHGGQGSGWMSHFHSVPSTGDAIVILTNSQRSWPFIAGILNAWSKNNGYSSPGMTRILLGEAFMWAITGLIFALAALTLASAIRLIAADGFAFSLPRGIKDWIKIVVSLFIIAAIIWCAVQPYLFVTTVFPLVSVWLAVSALLLALLVILKSLVCA